MVSQSFIVIATVILGYGLFSRYLQRTIITPPMVFVLVGLLTCESLTGLIQIGHNEKLIHFLGELTLIIVLFSDASRIDFKILRKDYQIPVRLLSIGLPLSIGLGTLAGYWLFPELGIWGAAVLATILAPTDAALGQAVVSSPKVPVRIRQALNVESGFNDGLCLPILLVFLATASMSGESAGHWVDFFLRQLLLGPITGLLIGYLGGRLVSIGVAKKWMDHAFEQLAALAIPLLAYALAESVHGNGFIAVFVAGLVVGNTAKSIRGTLYEFGEAEGQLLILIVFLIFGTVLLWPAFTSATPAMWLYAGLSLTLIRLIPTAISVLGAGLSPLTTGFLGWFGPRGLASILFGLLMLEKGHLAQSEAIYTVVLLTVFLSVLAHGLTAFPGAGFYARHVAKTKCRSQASPPEAPQLAIRGQGAFDRAGEG